jgi:hypothetical protein
MFKPFCPLERKVKDYYAFKSDLNKNVDRYGFEHILQIRNELAEENTFVDKIEAT